VFLLALRAGRIVRPFAPLCSKRLRALLHMIPDAKQQRPDILASGVFAAEGQAHKQVRKRVALLVGCAQQALDGAINAATVRLLTRHGCEVVIAAGTGCCGSLTLHMGRETHAMDSARANVRAWSRELEAGGLDAIVVNASGCGTTVKDYGHLLARDSVWAEPGRRVATLARDVSEFVSDIGLAAPVMSAAYRVAYHDPCSMQHGQRVTSQPRTLLRAAGFQVLDVPEKHFCCGSAGTYNLLEPDMAAALGRRKADHIVSTDPDIIATGNIGCMTQLRRYCQIPIVHTVELLDWATGGPRPPVLAGAVLREPLPPSTVGGPATAVQATGGVSDVGIW
jgi:glycolate oxidase iron-sulfur subunit